MCVLFSFSLSTGDVLRKRGKEKKGGGGDGGSCTQDYAVLIPISSQVPVMFVHVTES